MKRSLLLLVAVLTLVFSANAFAANKTFNVLGQPLATGLIQKEKEQPFFDNFAKETGLPIDANYKPIDVTGIKSEDTLRVLKSGLFDIVSIRTAQAARDEPFLLGQDIVGLNPDYKKARQVYEAYKASFDKRLQERFDSRLLGLWPFGPQVIFSRVPLKSLADLKGKKVRVYDQSIAQFMEKLGAIPVSIGFSETQQALSKGVVDAAITGASSANTAGWPEVTEYFLPLGFQVGFNGYAINKKTWDALSKDQQTKLQAAFDKLNNEIWAYSEELFQDALRCNTGQEPCTTVTKYTMKEVPVLPEDLKMVSDAVASISFPAWSEVCNKSMPGCSDLWIELLGGITGIKK